jgi:hypothetical protein
MESIQPFLWNFCNSEFFPGVETPGYFRNVPLGPAPFETNRMSLLLPGGAQLKENIKFPEN